MRAKNCIEKVCQVAVHEAPSSADIAKAGATVSKYLQSKGALESFRLDEKVASLVSGARAEGPPARRLMVATLAPLLPAQNKQRLIGDYLTDAAQGITTRGWGAIEQDLQVAQQLYGTNACLRHLAAAVRARQQGSYIVSCYMLVLETFRLQDPSDHALVKCIRTIATAMVAQDHGQLAAEGARAFLASVSPHSPLWDVLLDCSGRLNPGLYVALIRTADIGRVVESASKVQDTWLSQSIADIGAGNYADAAMRLNNCAALRDMLPVSGDFAPLIDSLRSAVNARQGEDIYSFYRDLTQALQQRPALTTQLSACLRRDVRDPATTLRLAGYVSDLCPTPESPLAATLLTEAANADCAIIIDALLDIGIGIHTPSEWVVASSNGSRDAWLQKATQWRWDVSAYTFSRNNDLFLVNPHSDIVRERCVYEMCQTPQNRYLSHMLEMADGGWDIVGMSCNTSTKTLHFLVRSGATRTRDYELIRHTDLPAALVQAEGSGASVCAYAQAFDNVDLATRGQREHVLVIDRSAPRAVHDTESPIKQADIPARVEARAEDGWRLCGLASESISNSFYATETYTLIFKRALTNAALSPRAYDQAVFQQELARLRRHLGGGQWSKAKAAVQSLSHASHPWVREQQGVAQALDAISASPWQACAALVDVAQPSYAQTDDPVAQEFARDILQAVSVVLRTQLARVDTVAALCASVTQIPLANPSSCGLLAQCIAVAALPPHLRDPWATPAGDPVLTALAMVIEGNAVSATSLLVALGADPDAPLPTEVETTAREAAVASGNPALCDALDGNVFAAREWARLGPVQRKTIERAGKNAATMSAAATDKLQARLLALGYDAGTLDVLRTYLRREASLLINFNPQVGNGLLVSNHYTPRGSGSASWANEGAFGPREQSVIYASLNATKSIGGVTAFGTTSLVLEPHVRARLTLVHRSKASVFAAVGTLHAADHVLMEASDPVLSMCISASQGDKMHRPLQMDGTLASQFFEVHVHGPLDFQRDTRKLNVFGPLSLKPEEIVALEGFAQRNQLEVHFRSNASIASSTRVSYMQRLSAAQVDVAGWYHRPDKKTDEIILQPGRFATRAAYRYEVHETEVKHHRRLVDTLGTRGFEILGAFVERPSNQLNATPQRTVSIVARLNPQSTAHHDYTVYRTYDLQSRLEFLRANHWQVCSYQQLQAEGSTTHEHMLIARHEPGETWAHETEYLPASQEAALRDTIATRAKAGWRLGGVAHAASGFTVVFKRQLDAAETTFDPAPALAVKSYTNDTTILGDSIASIPEGLLFVTRDGYAFDVDELVDLIEAQGVMRNMWTNAPLAPDDVDALVLHRSGAGGRLASMAADNAALLARLTPATAAQLRALSQVLAADPVEGAMAPSIDAVAAYSTYARTLSHAEQVALAGARFELLDTHNVRFALSVNDAVAGLQTHAGCSRATSRYLEQMAAWILARSEDAIDQPPAAS